MKKLSRRKLGFQCSHCKQFVVVNKTIGTHYRNHCPLCLWSMHVDLNKPGDRRSRCHGSMKPVGLVFKRARMDKYGKKQVGEIMLVHICLECHEISQNRIAADDDTEKIMDVFAKSQSLDSEIKEKLEDMQLAEEKNREEIKKQLFGKI